MLVPFIASIKDEIGKGLGKWTLAKAARPSSIRLLMALKAEIEWPQSSSAIALTLRVENALDTHLRKVVTKASSERWFVQTAPLKSAYLGLVEPAAQACQSG
jgi:hypothetical protein